MIDETKIMQYADGTLPQEEHEEIKKAIEGDPKLKELYNTFKETGDLLFNLGNEIKSQPIPKNVQEKINILKTSNKPVPKEFGSFNFFGLFKVQYAGIAAAFCLFFVGGFYTNNFITPKQKDNTGQVTALNQKINELAKELKVTSMEAPKKELKLRSLSSEEEDLQTRIQNLYYYFDGEKFLSEISQVIDKLKVNDVFESSLKDNDGKNVKFVLAENFSSKDGNDCKKVKFNEPLRLSGIDKGTDVTLDLCKINENYELSSINFTK